MDGSDPGTLRLWESPETEAARGVFGAPGSGSFPVDFETTRSRNSLRNDLVEMAEQIFACEALRPCRPRDRHVTPFSLRWFLNIEHYRHARQARWIPKIMEFTKHPGDTILGIGNGLGTDWLQYARNGASVIVCSSNSTQMDLVKRNFQLRGLSARFVHGTFPTLPIANSSIDVVCLNEMLQDASDPQLVVDEIFRVLKPGGKVIAVSAAKYDVDFWANILLWWRRLLPTKSQKISGIRYSGRRLIRLFQSFEEHRVHKRQLRRAEVPHLWRVVPIPVLERLIGRMLIIKAFKPISVVLPNQAAA